MNSSLELKGFEMVTRLVKRTASSNSMFNIVKDYIAGGSDNSYRSLLPILDELEKPLRPQEVVNLGADLFSLVYSVRQPEIVLVDLISRNMAYLVDTPAFKRLRAKSVLDPVIAALATTSMLEVMGLMSYYLNFPKQGQTDQDSAKKTINRELSKKVRKVIRIDEDLKAADSLSKKLCDGPVHGDAEGGSESECCEGEVPDPESTSTINRRLQLAMKFDTSSKLRGIFAAFGRVKIIENELLDDTVPTNSESSSTTYGDEIEKADSGYLATRPLEMLAMDLADGLMEQVDGETSGGEGLGPVIIMLDKSSSMASRIPRSESYGGYRRHDLSLATAFCLLTQAKDAGRETCLIPFNASPDKENTINSFNGGVIKLDDFHKLLGLEPWGGTCFNRAANFAMELVGSKEKADIVWLTDGQGEHADLNDGAFKNLVFLKDCFDSLGVRNFCLNYEVSGYPMRLLANAGPCKQKQPRDYLAKIPETEGKSRMYDNLKLESDTKEGLTTMFKEIQERSSGLGWLDS